MFKRPFRRIEVGTIPPALRQANHLMASGQYIQAAELFERFATGALNRNGPRAPWFCLQAGQARLLAGQVPQAMAHIQQGLSLFAESGQIRRLYHAGMRFAAELRERGLETEALLIEAFLKQTLPAGQLAGLQKRAGKVQPLLPVSCPSCGGPVRSDEVEWPDEHTAECPYCGSAIRAQG
jgi:hypothetical protein